MKVNVGIIGAGRIGRRHAENLAFRIPEARILAVADVRQEAAEQCAKELNIPSASANHRLIVENSDIDAIIICSSTDTHSRMIEEAALAGKHIFCEKPIDFDLTRIDRALKSVKKAGVKLQIGFNRRFDHNFLKVKETVTSGKIGKPHILRITSRDPEPPPIGGSRSDPVSLPNLQGFLNMGLNRPFRSSQSLRFGRLDQSHREPSRNVKLMPG